MTSKLWMFAYKMGSESAKKLQAGLGVLQIKHENSNFVGKTGQVILNWGAGSGVFCAHVGNALVLNPPHLVDIAVNKLSFFEHMSGWGHPRLPEWTTKQSVAQGWIEDGYKAVARTKLEGCKGAGLVVCHNQLDFIPAKLYTRLINIVSEYRVYMFNEDVIDTRIKQNAPETAANPDGVLIGEEVLFCQLYNKKVPEDVYVQAKKAAKKLGLTTCGLDIVWDGEKAYVIEANTAPYLGDVTVQKYVSAFKQKYG